MNCSPFGDWPRLNRSPLAHHLEALARLHVARVHLEVDEANAPARALYARHGFTIVGRRAGYYAKPDGTRATALAMTCTL